MYLLLTDINRGAVLAPKKEKTDDLHICLRRPACLLHFRPFFCAVEQTLLHYILGAMQWCTLACVHAGVSVCTRERVVAKQSKVGSASLILKWEPNYQSVSLQIGGLVPLFPDDRYERTH